MQFRNAFLRYEFSALITAVSVHLGCDYPAGKDALEKRLSALVESAKSAKIPDHSENILISYLGYDEEILTCFADMFPKNAIKQDFRDIPSWSEVNLDIIPDEGTDEQNRFFVLSHSQILQMFKHAALMRPQPISWTADRFEEILCADLDEKKAEEIVEAVISRFLCETGFPYRGIGGNASSLLDLPTLTEDRDILEETDPGTVYTWISCYKALQDHSQR